MLRKASSCCLHLIAMVHPLIINIFIIETTRGLQTIQPQLVDSFRNKFRNWFSRHTQIKNDTVYNVQFLLVRQWFQAPLLYSILLYSPVKKVASQRIMFNLQKILNINFVLKLSSVQSRNFFFQYMYSEREFNSLFKRLNFVQFSNYLAVHFSFVF